MLPVNIAEPNVPACHAPTPCIAHKSASSSHAPVVSFTVRGSLAAIPRGAIVSRIRDRTATPSRVRTTSRQTTRRESAACTGQYLAGTCTFFSLLLICRMHSVPSARRIAMHLGRRAQGPPQLSSHRYTLDAAGRRRGPRRTDLGLGERGPGRADDDARGMIGARSSRDAVRPRPRPRPAGGRIYAALACPGCTRARHRGPTLAMAIRACEWVASRNRMMRTGRWPRGIRRARPGQP
ncbi:hypothetical protein DFH07DRAFT_508052 [Mycena maculata]|uniref:Uncharacterized protein n=1 Tax=Mycena maculata TaxID=230809 RepID=A0AAD7K6V8_9AGAR|nr:hypothetical protein DFH07DRAFT_508052 [Mycena maculata]